jgi:hypothetical protein
MGYLGNNLNDYYPYQLLEEVIRRLSIKDYDIGNEKELQKSLKKLNRIIVKRYIGKK